jgi:hypothetical protein
MKPSNGKDEGRLPAFRKSIGELAGQGALFEEMRAESFAASDETEYRNQADGYFD